jgi:preprotein translocase subunit SecE
MGRLLRKKSPIKKKKSDEETPSAVSALTAEMPSSISPVSPSDEIRKKQVLTTKKPLSITKPPAPVPQSNTVVNKSLQFLREVKAELRKVTWPSRNQTLGSTAVVIILVAIISMFLGAVDIALARLVQAVLG